MNLTNYVKAGFPLLSIQTEEVKRCVQSINADRPFKVYRWNAVNGINGEYKKIPDLIEYSCGLNKAVLILENFGWFFEDKGVLQAISNNLELYKNNQVCLVIVGKDKINPFFEKVACSVDFKLPIALDFLPMVQNFAGQIKQELTEQEAKNIAENCLGLSYDEAENAIALEIVKSGKITIEAVYRAKEGIINGSGFMTVTKAESMDNVGGLEYLKEYLGKRIKAFEPGNEHLPKFKDCLLLGVPGTGKSLIAKALASVMQCNLITADIGSMKASLVGETERNTRNFTKTVDAIGKCCVMIEELEKAFAGSSNGAGDSGVSKGQLGHFLTWLQERNSEAVIIATANDISMLPPEFLRAGRWDTIFFVDYPTLEEREKIIEIMNKKHKANLPVEIAKRLEMWSGAEIEQLAKDSHFESVESIIAEFPTLWKSKRPEIEKLREQAKLYKRANKREVVSGQTRKIN